MWIDTRNCELTFHDIIRRDGQWIVLHGDGSECTDCEHGRSKDEDADNDAR